MTQTDGVISAERYATSATVVVPSRTEPLKEAALRELGGNVLVRGRNITEACAVAVELARQGNFTYLEDGDDSWLMAGASTALWEMLELEPELDAVIVPVGGGNLLAGALLAAAALRRNVAVVGVQSAAAPGVTESWISGKIVVKECTTLASGPATERPGALALAVMNALLERMKRRARRTAKSGRDQVARS